jgi:hypothetical protein
MSHALEKLQQKIDRAIFRLHQRSLANGRCCWPNTDIADLLEVSTKRIRKVIDLHTRNQTLQHNVGRPSKVTREIRSKVITLALSDGNLSDKAIAALISAEASQKIGRSTVNTIRKSDKGWFYAHKKRCQRLKPEQVLQRRQFLVDWNGYMYKDIRDKNLVLLFSDESRICNGSDNKRVWRKRGYFTFNTMSQEDKFPTISAMVWGAIGKGFKSKLVVIDGTVNTDTYLQVLKKFYKDADEKIGPRKWVFVQDGAACHTSQKAIDSICKKCTLNPVWPPNSPDLNPIEMVWAWLKRAIPWHMIKTFQEAKKAIKDAWKNISQDSIDRLCDEFPHRMELLAQAKGQTIQPLLGAHVKGAREHYLPDRPEQPEFHPWTQEEDDILWEVGNLPRLRSKWTDLSAFFCGRQPLIVKKRFRALYIHHKNMNPPKWKPIRFKAPVRFRRDVQLMAEHRARSIVSAAERGGNQQGYDECIAAHRRNHDPNDKEHEAILEEAIMRCEHEKMEHQMQLRDTISGKQRRVYKYKATHTFVPKASPFG